MCPVAAESKNSKPSSKKKINKKINTSLETVVEEESNINSQSSQTSSGSRESSIETNNEFSDSDEEDKGLGNIKLGPKGIYTFWPKLNISEPFILFIRITKFIIGFYAAFP